MLGRVVAGMRVADAIATVPVDHYGGYGPPDRPLQNVVVESIRIERGGPAAPASPAPPAS